MTMRDPGYDDTEMTPEDFEAYMAEGTPADISTSVGNHASGTQTTILKVPTFSPPPIPPNLRPMAASQA